MKEQKNVQWIRRYEHNKKRPGITIQALPPASLTAEEEVNWHKGKRKVKSSKSD